MEYPFQIENKTFFFFQYYLSADRLELFKKFVKLIP